MRLQHNYAPSRLLDLLSEPIYTVNRNLRQSTEGKFLYSFVNNVLFLGRSQRSMLLLGHFDKDVNMTIDTVHFDWQYTGT